MLLEYTQKLNKHVSHHKPQIYPQLPSTLHIWKHTTMYPQMHIKLHVAYIYIIPHS